MNELKSALADQTECHFIACYIKHHQAVTAALSQLPESFQKIDILINNAGLTDDEQYQRYLTGLFDSSNVVVDGADSMDWIIKRPAYVNINRIEIMPLHYATGWSNYRQETDLPSLKRELRYNFRFFSNCAIIK